MEILRARAWTEQNGASWQIKTLRLFEAGGLDRPAALAEMTRQNSHNMRTNEAVHTWPLEGSAG